MVITNKQVYVSIDILATKSVEFASNRIIARKVIRDAIDERDKEIERLQLICEDCQEHR